ncbi:hypothetical protein Rsub_07551 [Raphidocelis subcapitata]|uniref:Uncharacterized protein n=1 Tax=Raphidocelis subcapitata TaxID=307507 RepID=A0A2V0PAZ4_9CHLO|nr:hypothetical protein Rsub_07551 [Raphidocelis subcapitata]|eukprot:GBF95050.1 hypothetical protein Rsub_07551 [Raphidocelis subcapitata]
MAKPELPSETGEGVHWTAYDDREYRQGSVHLGPGKGASIAAFYARGGEVALRVDGAVVERLDHAPGGGDTFVLQSAAKMKAALRRAFGKKKGAKWYIVKVAETTDAVHIVLTETGVPTYQQETVLTAEESRAAQWAALQPPAPRPAAGLSMMLSAWRKWAAPRLSSEEWREVLAGRVPGSWIQ